MAERIGDLAYKLSVENAGFTSGMTQAGGQIDRLAQQSQAAGSKIQGAFAGVGANAQNVFQSLTTGGPVAALESIKGGIAGLGSSLAAAAGPAGLFTAGLVAGLTAAFAQARSVSKEIVDIGRFANSIGATFRDTQILGRVFERAGLDRNEARVQIQRLFNRLDAVRDDPNAGIGEALQKIGLNPLAVANAVNSGQSLLAIREIFLALQNTDDLLTKNRVSAELFGRSFTDLSRIINNAGLAFRQAEEDIDRFGTRAETVANAQAAERIWRDIERTRGSFYGIIETRFNEYLVNLNLQTAQLTQSTIRWADSNRLAASAVRGVIDAVAPLSGRTIEDMLGNDANAMTRLAATMRVIAPLGAAVGDVINSIIGNGGNSVAAAGQQVAQVAERQAEAGQNQLRLQGELLIGLREEARIRQQITDQFNRLRPESLALTGMDFNSLDNFKLLAGLQTRQNAGVDNPADRQVIILQAINDVLELMRQDAREANANAPRLAPAPRVGGDN
jgi:hypothetical protein